MSECACVSVPVCVCVCIPLSYLLIFGVLSHDVCGLVLSGPLC